jgi:RNA-directed DNA polymerase
MQARGMVSPSEAQTKRGETVRRESERSIVPSKLGNLTRRDPVEGRGRRVAEALGGNMAGASKPDSVSTKQQRLAELAQQSPQMGFTSLNHHLGLLWLVEAYHRTRKDGAPGVDGQTGDDYGLNLLDNLTSLIGRAKLGTYFAPPVRRVHIPKGTGPETRPLGIPTMEDKVLQRAVVMVLEPIYEQDFLDCSFGSRPGRSTHMALQALWQQVMDLGDCWLLDVDIRKFYDSLDHAQLRALLRQRVRDGVVLRLIDKWLSAGVLEDGDLSYPEAGTPQGGVISPLLANVYLHYVLDVWFEQAVKPCLKGRAFLVRYADDFVMGFACEEDARRVLDVLPKRLGKYGLTIHPDKTRLVPFKRPAPRPVAVGSGSAQSPGSFDFLGLTHYWSRSTRGNWVVKRKTADSRLRRAIRTIAVWCRLNRHLPIREQYQALTQKLRGHYQYYGVIGNKGSLQRYYYAVVCLWRKWLSRRKRRGQCPWKWFLGLLRVFVLPWPRAGASPHAASP